MDKILDFCFKLVVLGIVTSNGQYFIGIFGNRYYIGNLNTRGFVLFVHFFKAREIQIYMKLQQVSVIFHVAGANPLNLILFSGYFVIRELGR